MFRQFHLSAGCLTLVGVITDMIPGNVVPTAVRVARIQIGWDKRIANVAG